MLDWIILAVLVYLAYQNYRCTQWIERHEPWLKEHHVRGAKLEKSVCLLEEYAYRHPHDPALRPAADKRFCEVTNTPPDGWGGNPPPNGF